MSRKKKDRGRKAVDGSRLAQSGLDPNDPASALEKLAANWGASPDLEAWAVEQAAGTEDPAIGPRLAELEPRTQAKEVRRSIKRALYRLEQRGVWHAPDTPAPPSARELMGEDDSDAPQGWLSPIDPTGTRLVWMARKIPGGVASLSAVINEDHGVREFHSGKTNRKALREAHKEIADRSGIPLTEAPWEWVHETLRRAYETTERGRHPDVPRVLKTMAPQAPEAPTPAVDSVVDRAEAAQDETALSVSAELLGEPEVGTWLLPLPWMQDTLEKLGEADSSLVVVSPAAKEERMREALEGAVGEILDSPERRTRFADRLEESAFLLATRGADGHAKSALAAAIAAREGKAISEIPVLAEITRRSLALGLRARESKKQEEEKSSLVVTPQQAAAEQERARRGR